MNTYHKSKKGFTLLEILIVIAALGIIATIVILALDPGAIFADIRNGQREPDMRDLSGALTQWGIGAAGEIGIGMDDLTESGILTYNAQVTDYNNNIATAGNELDDPEAKIINPLWGVEYGQDTADGTTETGVDITHELSHFTLELASGTTGEDAIDTLATTPYNGDYKLFMSELTEGTGDAGALVENDNIGSAFALINTSAAENNSFTDGSTDLRDDYCKPNFEDSSGARIQGGVIDSLYDGDDIFPTIGAINLDSAVSGTDNNGDLFDTTINKQFEGLLQSQSLPTISEIADIPQDPQAINCYTLQIPPGYTGEADGAPLQIAAPFAEASGEQDAPVITQDIRF